MLVVERYQLNPKSIIKKKVSNVGGVVNQVSYRRGRGFYVFNAQIFPRSFGGVNFISHKLVKY